MNSKRSFLSFRLMVISKPNNYILYESSIVFSPYNSAKTPHLVLWHSPIKMCNLVKTAGTIKCYVTYHQSLFLTPLDQKTKVVEFWCKLRIWLLELCGWQWIVKLSYNVRNNILDLAHTQLHTWATNESLMLELVYYLIYL